MPKVKNSLNRMHANGVKLATTEAFFRAIEKGNIATVEALDFTDYHLAAKNSVNLTALHLAILQSNENLTEWLLAQGADPDLTDDLNHTPLHLASIMGQEPLVRLLLNSQASISKKDKQGKTPLQLAAKLGHTSIVNLLQKTANFRANNGTNNLLRDQMINHQQQMITHTPTDTDVNLTYMPVLNFNPPLLILKEQLAEKDNLISMQQEMLSQQQQEIQKSNSEVGNKNPENAYLKTQLPFFSRPINPYNAQFMTPFIEPVVILERIEEKPSNTNQVSNANLQTKPNPYHF